MYGPGRSPAAGWLRNPFFLGRAPLGPGPAIACSGYLAPLGPGRNRLPPPHTHTPHIHKTQMHPPTHALHPWLPCTPSPAPPCTPAPRMQWREWSEKEFQRADLAANEMLSIDEFYVYYYGKLCFRFPVLRTGTNPGGRAGGGGRRAGAAVQAGRGGRRGQQGCAPPTYLPRSSLPTTTTTPTTPHMRTLRQTSGAHVRPPPSAF